MYKQITHNNIRGCFNVSNVIKLKKNVLCMKVFASFVNLKTFKKW